MYTAPKTTVLAVLAVGLAGAASLALRRRPSRRRLAWCFPPPPTGRSHCGGEEAHLRRPTTANDGTSH